MGVIRKLASQTAVYGLSTMLGRFLNFLLIPLYLSKLGGSADYGLVSVLFTYSSFLAIVFAAGLETAFFQFSRLSKEPEKVLSSAVCFLFFSGVIALIVSQCFAKQIMAFIGYPNYPQFAQYFAIILAADAITSLGFAWLRQQEKPWTFAWIRYSNIGVNIGANLFFFLGCPFLATFIGNTEPIMGIHTETWQKLGLWFAKQSETAQMIENIFISNLLASLIVLPLMAKIWRNLKWGFDALLTKKMLVYSLPLVLVGLAGMVNETLDRILLKELLPSNTADADIGIYSAFYKLSLVLTLFIQAFRFAAEPFFFGKAADQDAPQTYALVMRYFVYVTGGIYLLTLVCLPWLAPLLLRKSLYYNDVRGLSIVPILLAANLCLGIYYNLSIWYKLTGKTRIGSLIAITGASITIFGNLVFIPQYGFIASAYVTLAAYGSLVILGYLFGQRYYPVPYQTKLILGVLGMAIVPVLLLHYLLPDLPKMFFLLLPLFYTMTIVYIEKLQQKKNGIH
ncbi:MAG: polysaccharide biosynthesis protein [Flavobacteriaceae bacterium]|nr:polysaccharide biosynthesis protein [Flavobacteriaceae bacterium]